jgi:hypothetical protein
MAKKDIQNRKKELQAEIQATKDLATVQLELIKNAQTRKALSNEAIGLKEQLLKKLESEESLTGQINSIQEAIDGMLREQIERGEEVNQHYIDQLDSLKSHLEKNKQIALAEQERNNLNEAGRGILKDMLGINSDIEAAVTGGALKALFLNKAFESVSASAKRITDGIKEGVTQLGLSANEAVMLQGKVEMASWSLTGFLYGTEAIAASAKAITAEYGNVNAASDELIKGVTELSAVTGDASSALKLAESFEAAGVPADEVRDKIEDISKEVGISSTMAVKGLENQMHRLVGASEQEIEAIIKGNAELAKRGTTMEKIEGLANNMLDIESSMRSEAKARALLGRDIGANEMRSLSAQLMTATSAEERAKIEQQMADLLLEQAGTAEEFNNLSLVQQNAMAEAYGMSREDLAVQIQKSEKQKELTEKYGEYAGLMETAQGYAATGLSFIGDTVLEMVKLIAKTAIFNSMMNGGSVLGNMKDGVMNMIGRGGGGGDAGGVPGLEATQDAGGQAAQSASGSGGGLKSLADGLREMGDGKVFAGIGAVALAGPAFIVALPSIPFLLFMGKVKLKALKENFTGLAEGLSQMSATFMGSLALGTFAIAAIPSILGIPFLLFFGKVKLKALEENFGSLGRGLAQMTQGILGALTLLIAAPALALGMLAIPFLTFMSIPGLGAVLSANFTGLSAGLAAFGNPGTAVFVLIGIGLMALLGAAMIPFAYALSLLSPLLEAFGNVVVGVMSAIPPIIQAIADGFVTMLGAITPEAIAGLLLLGPALMLASVGMLAFSASLLVGAFASFFGGGLVDQIVLLGMVGPGVASAGEGLALVAENIGVITTSMSGLGDLVSPLYALAGGLGAFAVAAGMGSLFGGGIVETIRQLSELGPGMTQTGNALDTISSTFGSLSSEMNVLSESMQKVAEVSGELWGVSGALLGIAGGLTAISFAGLLAIPTFAALGGLAAIAPTLMSLGDFFGFGGEGESDNSTTNTTDNSNKELLEEIKGLRNDIKGQPIVLNIDGKAVSRIQRVGRQQSNNRGAYQSL